MSHLAYSRSLTAMKLSSLGLQDEPVAKNLYWTYFLGTFEAPAEV